MVSNRSESSLLDYYDVSSGLSKSAKFFGQGYPFVSFKDVFKNTFLPEQLEQLVQSEDKERLKCSVKKGDVFITRTSETMHELGMSSVALKDYPEATFNGFTKRLRPKSGTEKVLHPEYVGYYLRSPIFRQKMLAFSTMSTRASLNNEMIGRLTISYPELTEQKRISGVLKRLDERIELNQQTNVTLEQMAQALFKSWFVDFDPVIDNALAAGNNIPEALQYKAEQRKQVQQLPDFKPLPDNIRALFPSEFEQTDESTVGFDGWIPKGWKASNIGSSFDVTMGQSPPGSTYNEIGEGIAFYQGRADFGFRYPKNRVYCTAPKRLANKFDTLVSVRAPVGDANMAKENCAIGRGVAAVRHQSGAISFTYYTIQNLNHFFERYEGEGTVFGSINQKDFKNLPYVAPDDRVISKFEAVSSSMDEMIDLNSKNLMALEKLRETLLPKLISGEIKLPSKDVA
ncbi:restriction endonuclease subunit S [Pseudoalteromonas sp. PAR1]|uniref:restriction endonuclease subunit S n=1 Tax=Pseudoalteromonas sp. PAR1 TaxID=2853443 RepID=UPI00248A98AA|nr:restriction endonuclease subunit S [Pseudoalteromonas sp. PAR1]